MAETQIIVVRGVRYTLADAARLGLIDARGGATNAPAPDGDKVAAALTKAPAKTKRPANKAAPKAETPPEDTDKDAPANTEQEVTSDDGNADGDVADATSGPEPTSTKAPRRAGRPAPAGSAPAGE